jgi:MraZ protein
MFLGQYRHSLDSKDRLTIPVRHREFLEEGAFVAEGFDRNLMILPEKEFFRITERVKQMSMTDPYTRLLRRKIYSTAIRIELDKAGRILIPQFLREFAGLEGEAILVGAGEYIEVWTPELWETQLIELEDAETNAERFRAFDLSTG